MGYNYPFRVGITGHKSLTEVEKIYVGKEINKTLVTIQRTIEMKKKAAMIECGFFISGISSLAEGADRVFASEIINLPGSLEVVLPLKKEIYMQDFWGEESKTEFLSLLTYDNYPLVMDNADIPHKELAYYQAAKCIVDQCDVLIAVWDETPVKSKSAGTENVIDYAKKQGVPTVILYPRPNKDKDNENKENLNSIDLGLYKIFDKEWIPVRKSYEALNEDILSSTSLKTRMGGDDYVKISNLLNAYNAWHKTAVNSESKTRNLNGFTFVLTATTSLTGIAVYFINHFELQRVGLTKSDFQLKYALTGVAMEKYSAIFHQSASYLAAMECLLLLALLFLFALAFQEPGYKILVQSRLWAEKMKMQVFKISVLLSGYERMDENDASKFFCNKSLDSRLYLNLTKDVWNNFKNPMDFAARVSILRNDMIANTYKLPVQKEKKPYLGYRAYARLSVTFLALGFLSACGLLLYPYFSGLFPFLREMRYLPELLQLVLLTVPVACLIFEAWHRRQVRASCNSVQASLGEIEGWFPEMCNTEEDLSYLFRKTESMVLAGKVMG